jgi:serine protease Do
MKRNALLLICLSLSTVYGDFAETCRKTWPKVVKIFGAGGLKRLHAYSSGIIVSPKGHILTVWNHVLETDELRVVLDDGQRFKASLKLVDTELEAAVIKIEAEDLPFYSIKKAPAAKPGEWVLSFSNAYRVATGNEKPTVMHGVISATANLKARRGVFESSYQGAVYLIDGITNNPGAGGGTMTNGRGDLIGMVGKELKSKLTNTWLNYAVPAAVLAPLVARAVAGETSIPSSPEITRPAERKGTAGRHGIVLVPSVLRGTPSYIDEIEKKSPAQKAGLQPDDLILFIEREFIGSCKNFRDVISQHQPGDKINVLVKRKQNILSIELELD